MSQKRIVKVRCPGCGHEADFEMWTNINTQEDPELAQRVRSLDLFMHVCPNCGAKTSVDHGFVYHQAEDRMIYYYAENEQHFREVIRMLTQPESETEKRTAQYFVQNDYIIRLVTDRVHLLEKLAIYDAGMDDRAIELFKVVVATQLAKKEPDLKYDKVLFFAPADQPKRIEFYDGKKVICSANISEEVYKDIVHDYLSQMPGLREDRNIRVDAQWAVSVMKKTTAEKD